MIGHATLHSDEELSPSLIGVKAPNACCAVSTVSSSLAPPAQNTAPPLMPSIVHQDRFLHPHCHAVRHNNQNLVRSKVFFSSFETRGGEVGEDWAKCPPPARALFPSIFGENHRKIWTAKLTPTPKVTHPSPEPPPPPPPPRSSKIFSSRPRAEINFTPA